MKYAKLVKTNQFVRNTPGKAVRVQYLEVKGVGDMVLKDGTKIMITPFDLGRTVVRETDLFTHTETVSFQ